MITFKLKSDVYSNNSQFHKTLTKQLKDCQWYNALSPIGYCNKREREREREFISEMVNI